VGPAANWWQKGLFNYCIVLIQSCPVKIFYWCNIWLLGKCITIFSSILLYSRLTFRKYEINKIIQMACNSVFLLFWFFICSKLFFTFAQVQVKFHVSVTISMKSIIDLIKLINFCYSTRENFKDPFYLSKLYRSIYWPDHVCKSN
jgi:hypothetical protein